MSFGAHHPPSFEIWAVKHCEISRLKVGLLRGSLLRMLVWLGMPSLACPAEPVCLPTLSTFAAITPPKMSFSGPCSACVGCAGLVGLHAALRRCTGIDLMIARLMSSSSTLPSVQPKSLEKMPWRLMCTESRAHTASACALSGKGLSISSTASLREMCPSPLSVTAQRFSISADVNRLAPLRSQIWRNPAVSSRTVTTPGPRRFLYPSESIQRCSEVQRSSSNELTLTKN
mmetsp:Transcript_935/g.1820  ORF Transcript_935/g.1820 Transcript_935/m.1820 type:complete len:230 (+) Transcript_935:926-1615(+)